MISKSSRASSLHDYDEQEQAEASRQRRNRVDVHDFEGGQYLLNLIDTPGHVDFVATSHGQCGAIDGVIILVDSVEGIMPQTSPSSAKRSERVRLLCSSTRSTAS